jgi:pimeloyl-[acyl-carrier protein] methyl ester esterase
VRPALLFAHGWALDRTLWDKVLEALGEDAQGALVLDAGYYAGDRNTSPLPHQGGRESILGVGQSLGALELLAAPPADLVGLVALDGFARFGKAPDFPEGVGTRVLERMKARLGEGVLAEFVERAGGELPKGEPDMGRLIAGLERLHALDGRGCRLPVWRLHADRDPIASLAMADASFAGMNVHERRIRQSTDHLSPLTAPHACADLIRTALKALSGGLVA